MYYCLCLYQCYFRFSNSTYSITVNTAANTLSLYTNGKIYPVPVGKHTELIHTTKTKKFTMKNIDRLK